ncbi:hypothetical protein GCM10029963_33040 [Micromonospora andamanensis]|uniref:DUF6879 family protein n=1 Tax=Micromonospora andamanensis TaxID=1287068 RepID=UPI001A3A18F0|nr:DUF6879 family protein [Micromonospora andamanensis]GIJ42040.1 hypothetical protein Vwe01_53650 [Micromonospora andamanensis]
MAAERDNLMQMGELQRRLSTAARSVFRLETLPAYSAAGEVDLLRDFHAGRPLPPRTPEADPWLRMVADSVQAGTCWSRVHVLHRPLSDYLRFELLGYHGNVAAGEDVRIADRATAPEALDALRQDFWLLDDEFGVLIEYDSEGRRLAMEPTRDVGSLIAQRDLAMTHSVPLRDYLPTVQGELRRSW